MPSKLFVCSLLLIVGSFGVSGLASAADEDRFQVVALVTPGGSFSDFDGFDVDFGFAAGFGWQFSQQWGLDTRVSIESGNEVSRETYDLGLRRSVQRWEDWSAHISFGVHHQETDFDFDRCGGVPEFLCLSRDSRRESSTGGFAGFDADWWFRESTSLRLDARYSVFDSEDSLAISAGLAFHF